MIEVKWFKTVDPAWATESTCRRAFNRKLQETIAYQELVVINLCMNVRSGFHET